MRAADDFEAIRARLRELRGERAEWDELEPPRRRSTWRVQRVPVEEIEEKTKEVLRRV